MCFWMNLRLIVQLSASAGRTQRQDKHNSVILPLECVSIVKNTACGMVPQTPKHWIRVILLVIIHLLRWAVRAMKKLEHWMKVAFV
jgi:hypothetical protein